MKHLLIFISSLFLFSSVKAQDSCPETLVCNDKLTVSAKDQSSISVFEFLENGSELDECDDHNFFLALAILDDAGEEISREVRGSQLTCPLTNGFYDIVISRNDFVDGSGYAETSTCFATLEIVDLNTACSGNSSNADLGVIFECSGIDKVGLIGESMEVSQGENICVPFRAKNFIDILAIQSEIVWDPEVLQFSEVRSPVMSIDNNDRRASEGVLRIVSKLNPELNTYTLDDDEVFIEFCFEVIGDSNESTLVSMGPTYDLIFEIVQEINGQPLIPEYCLNSGLITITDGEPLSSNFSISLNDQELETNADNFASVSGTLIQEGENTIIFETLEFDNYLENISSVDLVIGLKMFILDEPVNPLSAIALDVDQSGGINVADLVMIRQLILGQRIDLPHPGYFFVKHNFDFGPDFDVFDYGFYDRYTFNSASFDGGDLLFSTHKYGDPSVHMFHADQTEIRSSIEKLTFENKYIVKGQPTTIRFGLNGQRDFGINAFQLSLVMDGIEVNEIIHDYGSAFMSHYPENGIVNLLYANREPIGQVEFDLVVISNTSGFVSDMLTLNDQYRVELVKDDLHVSDIKLEAAKTPSRDFNIYPNPFTHSATVNIPQEYLGGELMITDVLGNRVYNSLITTEEYSLERSMLNSSGVYFITLETENRTMTRRLVFQE